MKILDYEQRSTKWFTARLGKVTGSRAKDMLTTLKNKKKEAAARRDLRAQLSLERITGIDCERSFQRPTWMLDGELLEAEALSQFEVATGLSVRRTGFIQHDELMAGCSLDGDVNNFEAIVEAKVPKAATHLSYLRTGKVPAIYIPQLTHNVWITGAKSAYFVSYGPEFPESLRLHIVEVPRKDLHLEEYEVLVRHFLAEVDAEVAEITQLLAKTGYAATA